MGACRMNDTAVSLGRPPFLLLNQNRSDFDLFFFNDQKTLVFDGGLSHERHLQCRWGDRHYSLISSSDQNHDVVHQRTQ